MQHRVAVVAVVVLLAASGLLPGGHAVHDDGYCERDYQTVKVGTGTIGIGEPLLHDINYIDLPFPSCSEGDFNLDHTSDPVLTQKSCSGKYVRVYASAGAVAQSAIINWEYSDGSGCS